MIKDIRPIPYWETLQHDKDRGYYMSLEDRLAIKFKAPTPFCIKLWFGGAFLVFLFISFIFCIYGLLSQS